jgi:hypothetical protein
MRTRFAVEGNDAQLALVGLADMHTRPSSRKRVSAVQRA